MNLIFFSISESMALDKKNLLRNSLTGKYAYLIIFNDYSRTVKSLLRATAVTELYNKVLNSSVANAMTR